MMAFGALSNILTITFCVNPFRLLSSMKWNNVLGLPSGKQKLSFIRKIPTVSMFMPSLIFVIQRLLIKYISRYLGRPVIALRRIDSYDGENVTFHYNRHKDNVFVKKTIPALDFISLLIQHIPEPHYKMTHYYGLYARHRDNDQKTQKGYPSIQAYIYLQFFKMA